MNCIFLFISLSKTKVQYENISLSSSYNYTTLNGPYFVRSQKLISYLFFQFDCISAADINKKKIMYEK